MASAVGSALEYVVTSSDFGPALGRLIRDFDVQVHAAVNLPESEKQGPAKTQQT